MVDVLAADIRPTILEICAGGGGLAASFRDEGWDHVDAIEINGGACATLSANLGQRFLPRDATKIDFTRYRGVDLCAGGIPCQPFSVCGAGRGVDDPRNLWETALRCVREAKPRLGFMWENVAALVDKRHRAYFDLLLQEFKELGYDVEWRVVCACEYGVPQYRRRVIVVGIAPGFVFSWPTGIRRSVSLGEGISGLPEFGSPAADAMYHIRPLYAARPYVGHTGSVLENPSKTLVSGCNGPPGGSNMIRIGDGTFRQYSIREYCRVQSLPDSFLVPSSISRTQAAWQIGNMVPYLLGRVFARQLRCALR